MMKSIAVLSLAALLAAPAFAQPPAQTPEQREARFILEQSDLLAHRGLRNIQPLGRAGEAPLLSDCERVSYLTKFQGSAL